MALLPRCPVCGGLVGGAEALVWLGAEVLGCYRCLGMEGLSAAGTVPEGWPKEEECWVWVRRDSGVVAALEAADATERLVLLEEVLAGQMAQRVAQRKEIERVLAGVPAEGPRQVLVMRYIDGMGFERIAEKLCYSVRQVGRLHNQALGELKIG